MQGQFIQTDSEGNSFWSCCRCITFIRFYESDQEIIVSFNCLNPASVGLKNILTTYSKNLNTSKSWKADKPTVPWVSTCLGHWVSHQATTSFSGLFPLNLEGAGPLLPKLLACVPAFNSLTNLVIGCYNLFSILSLRKSAVLTVEKFHSRPTQIISIGNKRKDRVVSDWSSR